MSDDHEKSQSDSLNRWLTRRQFLGGAAAVAGAGALSPIIGACGGKSGGTTEASPTGSGSGPKKGGILKAGILGGTSKDILDPHVANLVAQHSATFQLYNRLTENDPSFKIVNVLADELTSNDKATVWTARLKSDAIFSDGRPVTADDVIFSMNRIIDPKDPKDASTPLWALKSSGMRKVDKRTVEFRLESADSVFNEALAYRAANIIPTDWDSKTQIGTGPFKLKSYIPGEQTLFLPNENYNLGEGPYVDELQLIQFVDPTARVNALLGGTVDHSDTVSAAQIATVKAASGYDIFESESGYWSPFMMRIDQAPFDDVRVRQAFRLIVDRPQMITQAYDGHGALGNDMYGKYDGAYPSDWPQRTQDLEQAKALLKQAGQENLTVELQTSDAVGSGAVASAQIFAEQATGAGVTVNVNKLDSNVLYGEMYNKWTFAQDYWSTRNYLEQTTLGSLPGAQWNGTHWQNAKWQAIVMEAFGTVDQSKRNELVQEAEKIEFEEGGHIIWSFKNLLDGYSTKLAGLVHDPWGASAMMYRYNLVYYK